MKTFTRLTAVLLTALLALPGCVQISSIPNTARAGDSVVVGLGGINRNWGGEKPVNLQISITDAASQTFPLQPSVTFQAYPDYRSNANIIALQGSDSLDIQPYDGAWFVTVSLVGEDNAPLPLATGPATLHVSADNFIERLDSNGQPYLNEGNLSQIPLEIIPGPSTGDNSAAQYGAYEARNTHFIVRPAATSGVTIGGAFYTVLYQSDSEFGSMKPIVFPVSRNPFVKMDYKIQDNGDGTGAYEIYIYNPSGFTATTPRQPKEAGLPDLGVYLEYFSDGTGTMKTNFTLDAANSYFIDINGDRIDGLGAELRHADDI